MKKEGVNKCSLEECFPNVSFGNTVQVLGIKSVSIGEGACIGDDVWLNICDRDDRLRMKIGRCVLIGRQSVISTGGYLEIGDYCILAPRVYVSDTDHVFEDIHQPVIQQGATLGRSVTVEENCWLGINSVITGNLTVGRGSVVGANSLVIREVPPFSVVVGNPARIIKMYNPQTKNWELTKTEEEQKKVLAAREAFKLPTREEYKQLLTKNATVTCVYSIAAGRGESI